MKTMNNSSAKLKTDVLAAVHHEFAHPTPPLHRIRAVRRQQGVSLRGLARKSGDSQYELEREELAGSDLLLSRLYWWQQMLDVPVSDLLVEPSAGLSPGILERARMIRIMKTVAAIKQELKGESVQQLVATLESQLLEIMPEMQGVVAWNSIGQRRTGDELGRTAERTISIRDLMEG
jgi:transcriptional regulator with XRE-family HTH domain